MDRYGSGNFGEILSGKEGGVAKPSKKKYFSFMDFGTLILVVPLVWWIVSWAKKATNDSTPKDDPDRTGTFIMFLIAITLFVIGAFVITGMGSPR